MVVYGQELSIKTVTGDGKIRMLWTPDSYKAGKELALYRPEHDLFLCRIQWGRRNDGVYYIPKSVQHEVYDSNPEKYLHVPVGTNHRGAELTTQARNALLSHSDTIRRQVTWTKKGMNYTPYNRWEEFWKSR